MGQARGLRGALSPALRLMTTIPWFERKFDFTLPLELMPQLSSRLRGTPDRLEEVVRRASSEQLTKRTAEGGWSPQEHAGHLADLEVLWIERVQDFVESRERLTPADLTNRKTNEANHNEMPVDALLKEFRALRNQLLDQVSNLDRAVLARTLEHPRLKTPMRLIDHLYFVAEHDDHHLAEIRKAGPRPASD